MIEFLKEFGESRNLDTQVDKTGNVIIRKPATKGYEDRKTVILQSHMDMVCEKLVDVDIDFTKDAIQTYVDGEWMKAKELLWELMTVSDVPSKWLFSTATR